MEDYEEQLHGVEDDFHSQFAAELEVLAELEGGLGPGGRDVLEVWEGCAEEVDCGLARWS